MQFDQLIDSLSRITHQSGQAVENMMKPDDLNNPEAMLKVQFAIQQYSNLINVDSALIKTIKDMLSGIIAKI